MSGYPATGARRTVPGLWLEQAMAGEDAPRVLAGDLDVDVCIVGGGYTGLWTALRVKEYEPTARVAVVEATVCGGGASGRNSGFLLGWWRTLGTLEACCGTEEALRLVRAAGAVGSDVAGFCAEHAIDAQIRKAGWVWAATNSRQAAGWERVRANLARFGLEVYEPLSSEELERMTGTPRFHAGVIDRTGVSVQPALLARGLRRVAIERGIEIFERSPMIDLRRTRSPQVRTRDGTVTARTVVLAMNAWLSRIGEIGRNFFVIAGDMLATEPVPARLEALRWASGGGVSDSRLHIRGARTTDDGRIVFGLGGTRLLWAGRGREVFGGVMPTERVRQIRASFADLYPHLADVSVASTWVGPVDKSATGLPFFGRLENNPEIIYGAGYSGNGVGPSYLGGRMLAAMALRRGDEWERSATLLRPRGGLPPEPIRFLGGRLVKAAVARSERLRDAGHEPSAITRALAARVPGASAVRAHPAGDHPLQPRRVDDLSTHTASGEKEGS